MLNPIDEIKNRLDVVEVIGSYIKVQKAGQNYRAVCPFHSEKKPSFFISPSRQIWHCFGCSKGGDIFGFVKEIEGVEFGDALKILANKAGVELKRQDPKLKTERQRLYEICELATKFFEAQLKEGKGGELAKKYLMERGIKEESLSKWRVGYAPDAWQSLSDFLSSRGYEKIEVEKAGLALASDRGSTYDRFRGRIIFPIFDLSSQVVGFGGRVFKDKDKAEVAKYVNTPQTLLYDKSGILYGLDKAKVAVRKNDKCILVEGYLDLITVFQAGFENVVATSGTALTPYQLRILKRYTGSLLTAFDMDVAGDSATKRGIDLAQAQGFNVKVVSLPEGQDPADVVTKDPKEWEKRVEKAKSIFDFYFENTFAKFDKNNPEGKREISKIILPIIKRIPNRIEQAHWISKLSKELEVGEEAVEEELSKARVEGYSEELGLEKEEMANLVPKTRKQLLEERIIMLSLKSSEIKKLVQEKDSSGFCVENIEILDIIKKSEGDRLKMDYSKIPVGLANLINRLCLQAEIEEIEDKDLVPEMNNCFKELELLGSKEKLSRIAECIKEAEIQKDFEKVEELTKQFNSLIHEEKKGN